MITDFHDVFGSLPAKYFLPDIRQKMGSVSVYHIEAYLASTWDTMYGRDSEAVKPDRETFHSWAIQVEKEVNHI